MDCLVISHLICNYVTNKKVGCLDSLVWVRFVVDLLNEFYQKLRNEFFCTYASNDSSESDDPQWHGHPA